MTVPHFAAGGNPPGPPPVRPDPGTPTATEGPSRDGPSPGTLTALRCPLCEGPVYQPAPGELTCPACASKPAPTPAEIARAVGLPTTPSEDRP